MRAAGYTADIETVQLLIQSALCVLLCYIITNMSQMWVFLQTLIYFLFFVCHDEELINSGWQWSTSLSCSMNWFSYCHIAHSQIAFCWLDNKWESEVASNKPHCLYCVPAKFNIIRYDTLHLNPHPNTDLSYVRIGLLLSYQNQKSVSNRPHPDVNTSVA